MKLFPLVPVSTKESCARYVSQPDEHERVGDCLKKRADISSVYHLLMRSLSLVRTGFAIMILNLIKVLQTTRAHPRVGVLIATVIKGIDDIVHFGILFLIVFITFAW